MYHVVALRSYGLCDFAFVVREYEVHAATVDVEVGAEIFTAHRGAFAVPTGETIAPRRRPAHDVFGLGFLPEREVDLVALFAHAVELAAGVAHIVEVAAGEHAVVVFLVVFFHVEINRTV